MTLYNDIVDGKRVLILRISFGTSMVPYVSQLCEYVDLITPNLYSGSINEYIEEYRPDVVIVAYTVRTFQSMDDDGGDSSEFFDFD